MIEPTLALQTAIRAKLIAAPAVTALVSADQIRAGSTRPGDCPCIITGSGTTTLHGHDYTGQRAAWIYMDLHVWTKKDDDSLTNIDQEAKQLAFAVSQALNKSLSIEGGYCDQFHVTGSVFPRDPDPTYGHGVINVEAFVRWII
jgi:hypothetical protein